MSADEAPARLDETIPGGRYLVNGTLVDANGEPLTKAEAKAADKLASEQAEAAEQAARAEAEAKAAAELDRRGGRR